MIWGYADIDVDILRNAAANGRAVHAPPLNGATGSLAPKALV
jgi:hypothetical protein